jgi:regulator of cell morphogenesis and NO signaling
MNIQHPYLKKALSTFMLCSSKIIEANKKDSKQLSEALLKLGTLVEQHLIWEEQIFFPALRLKIAHRQHTEQDDITDLINKIRSNHYSITKLINKNRLMSNDYVPGPGASSQLKLCYAQLFDFEQDILKHIFLEEDLLFPKLFNKTVS